MISTLLLVVASLPCAATLDNGLGLTPLMGWSSWNHYHRDYTEDTFYQTAESMAANGMRAAGYHYVWVDGGWWEGADTGSAVRNASGHMQVSKAKFPRGIPALIKHVHSLGLKWGHYTDAGSRFCNGDFNASRGHEAQDATLFAEWGVDALKLDNCFAQWEAAEVIVSNWSALLNKTGRPIHFANCRNGCLDAETQGGSLGMWGTWCQDRTNSWRTGFDIGASWGSIMGNLKTLIGRGTRGKPGSFADPDFLEVGNGHLSSDEDQSHFSLWAVTSSPLVAGNDVVNMSSDVLRILTNKEIIAINQAYAGNAGDVVQNGTVADGEGKVPWRVWAKALPDGEVAAVLVNEADVTMDAMELPFSSFLWASGVEEGVIVDRRQACFAVRDLVQHLELGSFSGSYVATNVPSHASVTLRLKPSGNCSSTELVA